MRLAAFILADGELWLIGIAMSGFAGFLAAQRAIPGAPIPVQVVIAVTIVISGFLFGYAGWRILSRTLLKPTASGVVIPLLATLFVLVLYAAFNGVRP
jgi:hypothetical protein